MPGLLGTESVSAGAAFPHRTFEVGKVAVKRDTENYGIATRQYLGFLATHPAADYNEAASHVAALMYFIGKEFSLEEGSDPRFIPGRQAVVMVEGERCGVFGEINPSVLEAFGIGVPSAGGELDLDSLLRGVA